MRPCRLDCLLYRRPYSRHSSPKPKRKFNIAFISRYSPSVSLRLSSTPSGKPIRARSQRDLSSSRYRGQNTLTITFWGWNGLSKAHESIILVPVAKTTLLVIWEMLFLYQLIHFSRGIYRVHRLRRDAWLISPSEIGMAGSMIEPPNSVVLLESTAIDDPVTVGVFHPEIILPSKVIPALDEPDLTAILAHEYGHILRKDFLVHLLCQLTALPVAWHPGIQYLMSKISQTRELACDDYAAVRLGKRIVYARTLLRLASLCLQVPRCNAMGLGIFDGDNLEARIMMLTEKRTFAIPRPSDWPGFGNRLFIRIEHSARARSEPARSSCIHQHRADVHRNLALDVPWTKFHHDDSGSERLRDHRLCYWIEDCAGR